MIVETHLGVGASTPQRQTVTVDHELTSLGEVLTQLVEQELAAYAQYRESSQLLTVLTPADLALGAGSGKYGREPRTIPPAPSLEVALVRAQEAFGDGLYFVFLDGRQVTDWNETLIISSESVLRLVRLVALTGG